MSEAKCDSCHQPVPAPKNEWLTSEEVVEQYGFDPLEYVVGDKKITSKLLTVTCGSCRGLKRVWLKADVEWRAGELGRKP